VESGEKTPTRRPTGRPTDGSREPADEGHLEVPVDLRVTPGIHHPPASRYIRCVPASQHGCVRPDHLTIAFFKQVFYTFISDINEERRLP